MEIVLLSLFVGSLGYEAIVLGNWLQRHQQQDAELEEEEETLTRYEPDEQLSPIQPFAAAKSAPSPHSAHSTTPEIQGHASVPSSSDPRLLGWEFKIVRANRELFRDPGVFQRLCKEEAEAGWIMLEKLDDRRVRFKRPIALREILQPDYLPYDPYRTHYGSSARLTSWLGLVAAVTAIVLPAYLGYALVFKTTSRQPPPATFPSPTYPSPSLP